MTHSTKGVVTHIYEGDTSTYGVRRTSQPGRNNAVEVRIMTLISGPGTIPIGEYVYVSRRRLESV